MVNKGKWDTGGGEIQVALKVLKDNSLEGVCSIELCKQQSCLDPSLIWDTAFCMRNMYLPPAFLFFFAAAKTKFLQEAAIIGQFSHANIIRLCGVVTVGKPVSSQ